MVLINILNGLNMVYFHISDSLKTFFSHLLMFFSLRACWYHCIYLFSIVISTMRWLFWSSLKTLQLGKTLWSFSCACGGQLYNWQMYIMKVQTYPDFSWFFSRFTQFQSGNTEISDKKVCVLRALGWLGQLWAME